MGQPFSNKEYLTNTIRTALNIKNNGWLLRFKWTPSHVGIIGNEKADELANKSPSLQCPWARCTLTWLKHQPKNHMIGKWKGQTERVPILTPPPNLQTLRLRIARLVFRVRTQTTLYDTSPLVAEHPICQCGANCSSFHLVMECPRFDIHRTNLFNHLQVSKFEDIFSHQDIFAVISFLKVINLLKFSLPFADIVTEEYDEV
jgi:hypothetical protein